MAKKTTTKPTPSTPAVGEIQTFTHKPVKVRAIQFTGKNGKACAEFIRENSNNIARNGGNWLKITFVCNCIDEVENGAAPCAVEPYTIKKGSFIAVSAGGHLGIMDEEELREHFIIGKNAAIL